jgi:hypothetical protein
VFLYKPPDDNEEAMMSGLYEAQAEAYYRECDPLNLDSSAMQQDDHSIEMSDAEVAALVEDELAQIGRTVAHYKDFVAHPRYAYFMREEGYRTFGATINPLIVGAEAAIAAGDLGAARDQKNALVDAAEEMRDRVSDLESD